MKKIIKLASLLRAYHLYSEASDVLSLRSAEHPDWKDEWEEPKDYSPEDVMPTALSPRFEKYDGSVESKMNKILSDLGITISFGETGSPLGEGAHGSVYRCIYSGKPSVVKVQIYRADDEYGRIYGKDVESIEKIMNIWDTVPDFVKKHIPNVFLAKKGSFFVDDYALKMYERDYLGIISFNTNIDKAKQGGEENNKFNYQITVMEELQVLPKKLQFSIEGSNWQDNPESAWLWEEELDNFYPRIWNEFEKRRFQAPSRAEFSAAIKKGVIPGKNILSNIKEVINKKINEYYAETASEGRMFYFELSDIISDLSKSFTKSIPRWGSDEDGSPIQTSQNYIPRDVSSLWEAIKWLRENGFRANDITPENIMIDQSGVLKIADLGCL
jgi:serine/threonine protein kinase